MSNQAASFVGSIPETYDRGLGPVLFQDYAVDTATRVAALAPENVLETAAGTGIVTRALRDRLPAATALTSTDLNPPMLEVASKKFRPGEKVEFKPADALELPFDDGAFDVLVCQYGVMFFPDKQRGYHEARRVLANGGHYVFTVWDSHRHNPLGALAHRVVGKFFPVDPPQFYTVPFGYHQVDVIREQLHDAGFTDLRVAILPAVRTVADPASLARALVEGNPLIDQIRQRGGVEPTAVVAAVSEELGKAFGRDPMRIPMQTIFFEARKP